MRVAYLLLVAVIAVMAAFGYLGMTGMIVGPGPGPGPEVNETENATAPAPCTELNYYFRSSCSHCQDVIRDGSLDKLEALGVNVTKYEVVEWGMYGINQVPTFEFGGESVSGYKTFEELKELLGCGD